MNDESDNDKLLNAALGDGEWAAMSAGLRERSLRTFRVRRNLRRGLRLCMAILVFAVIGMAGLRFENRDGQKAASGTRPASGTHPVATAAKASTDIPRISDEELVALFPRGSCAIAEIDGRKQLVFFDEKQAEQGYALGPQ